MVAFDNTEIAFKHKSDFELRKSYWLFRLIGSPALVKIGKFMVNLALKLHIPIGWALKRNIFSQFCGGETIEECAKATQVLDSQKVGTILDFSVEGKDEEVNFDQTAEEILHTIQTAHGNEHIPFCVFKVTGISRFSLLQKVNDNKPLSSDEQEEWNRVKERMNRLAHAAWTTGTPLFIDAEESWIQDAIDALVYELMALYNKEKAVVYNTLQMYRHDRLQHLENALIKASDSYFLGFKLVRGAYMEKERERAMEMAYPSPIQKDKASSDKDFDAALSFCVKHLNRISICAGTHNENSSGHLCQLMLDAGIPSNDKRVWFAQLFGMSDHISFNLSNAGYNVAKYVPYGPIREVIPYLIRRAEENTSVKGQTGRELSLIQEEIRRRRS
jgi:proline dehydrogenase